MEINSVTNVDAAIRQEQMAVTQQKRRKKLITLVAVGFIVLIILILLFVFTRNYLVSIFPKPVAPSASIIVPPATSPIPTLDPTNSWQTYKNNIFSVKYPPGYIAEEREKNFVVIFKDEKSALGEAGISIDARLQRIYADYDTAVQNTRDNLADISEEELADGIKLSGKIAEGLGIGISLVISLIPYGDGAIAIESSGENVNYHLYDQVLSTFTLLTTPYLDPRP